MKTIISDENEIISKAAELVCSVLRKKSDAVIALVGGRSVEGLYRKLAEICAAGELSFKNARFLGVADYVAAPKEKSHSHQIKEKFLAYTDANSDNIYFPQADDCAAYDALVEYLGGIDLAILGLGENAHIGYNEPATPYASSCRVQKLTEATKRQNALMFGGAENVPETAVTMGIKTLCDAREIMLLAFGENKAQAVHKMLYGRNDSVVPAAFLQIPMNVTVLVDKAAASQL